MEEDIESNRPKARPADRSHTPSVTTIGAEPRGVTTGRRFHSTPNFSNLPYTTQEAQEIGRSFSRAFSSFGATTQETAETFRRLGAAMRAVVPKKQENKVAQDPEVDLHTIAKSAPAKRRVRIVRKMNNTITLTHEQLEQRLEEARSEVRAGIQKITEHKLPFENDRYKYGTQSVDQEIQQRFSTRDIDITMQRRTYSREIVFFMEIHRTGRGAIMGQTFQYAIAYETLYRYRTHHAELVFIIFRNFRDYVDPVMLARYLYHLFVTRQLLFEGERSVPNLQEVDDLVSRLSEACGVPNSTIVT